MKLFLPVLALIAASAPVARSQDAVHGKALFLRDGCWECHGTVGQGTAAGPRLAPGVMPAAAIAGYIRAPGGQMPPYSAEVISDSDIADIHAYLGSLPKPAADVAAALGERKR